MTIKELGEEMIFIFCFLMGLVAFLYYPSTSFGIPEDFSPYYTEEGLANQKVKSSRPFECSATGESLSKKKVGEVNFINAEVISVNERHREIQVKDLATGNYRHLKVADPRTLSSFGRGDRVRVSIPGVNADTAVNVIAEENY